MSYSRSTTKSLRPCTCPGGLYHCFFGTQSIFSFDKKSGEIQECEADMDGPNEERLTCTECKGVFKYEDFIHVNFD